mmetsp:Transcript_60736/g.135369  ORF Transcript_60736/g.135369 Transcript_60736/m.135369 type:complete len:149 (-) Transcript_60736:144-590(-)
MTSALSPVGEQRQVYLHNSMAWPGPNRIGRAASCREARLWGAERQAGAEGDSGPQMTDRKLLAAAAGYRLGVEYDRCRRRHSCFAHRKRVADAAGRYLWRLRDARWTAEGERGKKARPPRLQQPRWEAQTRYDETHRMRPHTERPRDT